MINKVILLGRLGKDPEVRHFENDGAVCNFSLATSLSFKNKEGNREEKTEWHNLVIWRRGLVGVAEKYLKKGSLIYIEGRLASRSWDDQNGNKRYTTEVIVENLKMLDGKPDSQNVSVQANIPSETKTVKEEPPANDDIPDDLPF